VTLNKHWQPTASIANLQCRAALLATLRRFFAERDVLEAETPLLAQYSVTDPHMHAISAANPCDDGAAFYLQTSPEYAMKRLLAAGSGAIYQICKAFRRGETSRRHNPEFTLLEWYRPGFDYQQLMMEVADLLQAVGINERCTTISYRELFQQQLAIDPHHADSDALRQLTQRYIDTAMLSDNRDDWLHLLMAEKIEPTIGLDAPVLLYDYPASQAALAVIAEDARGTLVAQRFELYYRGVELANGYQELCDAELLQQRLCNEQRQRRESGRSFIEVDDYLLAAARHGIPECSGVALGIDRLLMALLKVDNIDQIIALPSDRA
jgi:lysyl-tRNA synthetase class 2